MWRGVGVAALLGILAFAPATEREEKAWTQVFSAAGIRREDLGITPLEADFFGGGKYRLHFFDYFWQRPLTMPEILGPYAGVLRDRQQSAGWLAMQGVYPLGISARRNLIESPADEWKKKAAQPDGLSLALKEVFSATGRKYGKSELKGAVRALSSLPEDLRFAIAVLLFGMADSLRWREYALRNLNRTDRETLAKGLLAHILKEDEVDPKEMRKVEETLDRVDFADLYVGGIDLALAVDAFIEAGVKREAFPARAVRVETPVGMISIGGIGDDTYESNARWLVVVDPGGNDAYRGAGYASGESRPVSVVIDYAGNDAYGTGDRKGTNVGGALLGYALITDLAGDDAYESGTLGAGAASIGLALVHDFTGNDRYSGYIVSQGAGHFGVGVLADLAGDDTYYLYQKGQGYGFTLGSGVLFDAAGNDRYTAEDRDIQFPSPQTKEHNVSLAQGAGYGKRADYIDQHSLAGGIGLLVDLKGDDFYECGVFGQGVGYWYGVGALFDLAGNDSYDGIWYVQAASAHFAVGILYEGGGNDRYRATMNMAQGAGHDFSVGYLLDEAGNDVHESPNLSLGGGNANGVGIFWDRGGDDIYAAKPSIVLGRASVAASKSIRERMRTIGVFLDTGSGNDAYFTVSEGKAGETPTEQRVEHPVAKNNALWQQPGANQLPTEIGVGLDE